MQFQNSLDRYVDSLRLKCNLFPQIFRIDLFPQIFPFISQQIVKVWLTTKHTALLALKFGLT